PVRLLSVLAVLFGVKNAARFVPNAPLWLALAISCVVSVAGIALVLRWLCGVMWADPESGQDRATFLRRLGVLVVVVVVINSTWHFFRAWLPLFLQKQHAYGEGFMNWFMLAYYVSTDAGTLTAGAVTLALVRRGFALHASRLIVFGS